MANPTPQDQTQQNAGTAGNNERDQQLAEAAEMRERGTLTPESKKQGATSHLPVEETEYMYRTEDERDDLTTDKKDLRKTA
ncbi:hypothetical protein AB4Y89_22055 [Terriglobus sp. 2YAB30_2]|uniref:hypothetical protein n=1 Tax=Terriglobus sp. 2YAB30_2 TaxID=3233023 RepID=UPI003F966048